MMAHLTSNIAALLVAGTTAAHAADISVPLGAELSAERADGLTSQQLPIGAYRHGEVPSIWAEGSRTMEVWQSPYTEATTLQVINPIKDQLVEQGFDVLFECRDAECGGFDFRFAQDLLPEPDMHVNLTDFRFLSAQRMGEETPEYISLMVSRSRSKGYVHITRIGAEEQQELVPTILATKGQPSEITVLEPVEAIGVLLERDGVAVLEDLEFATGSSALSSSNGPLLASLADYLVSNPDRSVSLVGHTDAVGSQAANVRLSKARAGSVRNRLVNQFGVNPGQVDAQGVGYLAPLASNLSEDGRSLNRRVEVVLTSTN